MAVTTLPSLTDQIDTRFVHTFYSIRKQTSDQILNGTPIWNVLKQKGCLKTKKGGKLHTRTVYYATPTVTEVDRGDSLGEGEVETDTMAMWGWRNLAVPVQRSWKDDQENQGEDKIRDFVTTKIDRAKDALIQKFESQLFNTHVSAETGKLFQGLNDMVPPVATRNTGTYGKINRPTNFTSDVADTGNIWWTPKYLQSTNPSDVGLVSDMRTFFNTISANYDGGSPDLIVMDQTRFELYHEFGLDLAVVNKTTKQVLDLGFQASQFNGATMVWTPNITSLNVLFLNTAWIDVMYDPTFWMSMTPWKDAGGGKTGDRLAHILCVMNMLTDQPRRHGRLVLPS